MTKQRFISPQGLTKLSAAVVLACLSGQSVQAQTVLDYAARWKFDDCAASAQVSDSSGNNNTATRGSMVQCTTDRDGKAKAAALFSVSSAGDGSAQTNVTLANNSLAFSNNITVSTVIKPTATPEGALITKGWVSGANKGKVFQLGLIKDASGSGKIQFTVWTTPATGGAAVPEVLTSAIAVPAAKWSRVSASYTPGKSMEIYLDGSVIVQRTGALAAIADVTNGSSIWLGGGVGTQTKGYLGTMDDTWVSNGSCADIGTARVPDAARELMITNLSVVEDQVRTTGRGAWTFANLMEQMVPANANPQVVQDAAADMVLTMLQTWNTDQVINGFTVPARPAIQSIIDAWPKSTNGKLDLTQAPVRLLAIVNRMDKRDIDKGSAGEGRFVFGVTDASGASGNALPFTMIFEYNLPAQTMADIRQWGKLWHDLGTKTLGTSDYNAALQALTDKFSLNGLQAGRTNGNPINQVRTNEIALAGPWELREFNLKVTSAGATNLVPVPVKNNPDLSFNVAGSSNSALLSKYINKNAVNILLERHETPSQLDANGAAVASGGTPFTAGSSLNNVPTWNTTGLVVPTGAKLADGSAATVGDLMHKFALNTCNGCHNSRETGSGFLQINTRAAGQEATLSRFLTSTVAVTDPRSGQSRVFNDLGRRVTDLQTKVIASCPAPVVAAATTLRAAAVSTTSTTTGTTNTTTSLGKGISRVD